MRKANRIMLKAVAILLCLVIFTTCIVSSTFAKFVITKSTKTEMTLEQFGVTLQVEVNGDVASIDDSLSVINGNSLAITLNPLDMLPGSTYDHAIKVTVSENNRSVPVKITTYFSLKIHPDLYLNKSEFADASMTTAQRYYMPLEFTIGNFTGTDEKTYNSQNVTNSWRHSSTATDLEKTIESEMLDDIKTMFNAIDASKLMETVNNDTRYYMMKTYDTTTPIVFKDGSHSIGFGFKWPLIENDDVRSYMETKIADIASEIEENEEYPLQAVYIIKIEQTKIT